MERNLQPQASITLGQAIASAQKAAAGPLGQVDLEHYRNRLVYMVDVGDQEVRVDARERQRRCHQPGRD